MCAAGEKSRKLPSVIGAKYVGVNPPNAKNMTRPAIQTKKFSRENKRALFSNVSSDIPFPRPLSRSRRLAQMLKDAQFRSGSRLSNISSVKTVIP